MSTKKKQEPKAAEVESPEVAPVESTEAANAPEAEPAEEPAEKKKSKKPEHSAELKAALEGIFRDDPQAEAYYSEDEKTFLNALQYEKLENKKGFVKYPNPK